MVCASRMILLLRVVADQEIVSPCLLFFWRSEATEGHIQLLLRPWCQVFFATTQRLKFFFRTSNGRTIGMFAGKRRAEMEYAKLRKTSSHAHWTAQYRRVATDNVITYAPCGGWVRIGFEMVAMRTIGFAPIHRVKRHRHVRSTAAALPRPSVATEFARPPRRRRRALWCVLRRSVPAARAYNYDRYATSQDCQPATVCGNGQCEAGETVQSCPQDCFCGNGVCDVQRGETQASCPQVYVTMPVLRGSAQL